MLSYTYTVRTSVIETSSLRTSCWHALMTQLALRWSTLDYPKISLAKNLWRLWVDHPTTSLQRYSYKITIQRLISGPLVLSSILCYLEKCHFQETQSLRSSEMWSKAIFISIMSLSHDTQHRQKNFYSAWLKKTWTYASQQNKHSITPGSKSNLTYQNSH